MAQSISNESQEFPHEFGAHSIMNAIVECRPESTYAVGVINQYQQNHGSQHYATIR